MSDRIAVMHARRDPRRCSIAREATQARIMSLALASEPPDRDGRHERRGLQRHRREVSVAIAIVALAAVLAVVAPAFFAARQPARSVPRQPAGADRRARHDAGHPHRPDRHLGRLDLRDLRASSPACWPRPACRCRWWRWRACAVGARARRRQRRARRLRAHPVDRRRRWRRWWRCATGCAGSTQGAWIQDLPADFQWLGHDAGGRIRSSPAASSLVLAAAFAWGLRHLAGRPRRVRDRLEPATRRGSRACASACVTAASSSCRARSPGWRRC